jgi:hypothetical protein
MVKTRTTTEAIIGGVTGSVTVPTNLLLGRYDTSGRLRYAGFTTRLTSAQSVELGALLHVTTWNAGARAAHPWPQPLPANWLGRFSTGGPLPTSVATSPSSQVGRPSSTGDS